MTHKHHGNMLVLVGLYLGNFFYSVSKRSLNASFPLLKTALGATKSDLGDMSSEFSFAYGVSKLLGGVLSDLFPSYTLYTVGLYAGAILNLVIAGASDVSTITFLWMLNGLAQGPGGPALSRLVIEHYPPRSRGRVWSSLTFSCNLGYLLAAAVLAPSISFGWQGPFVSIGVLSLLSSILMTAMYVLYLRPPPCSTSVSTEGTTSAEAVVSTGVPTVVVTGVSTGVPEGVSVKSATTVSSDSSDITRTTANTSVKTNNTDAQSEKTKTNNNDTTTNTSTTTNNTTTTTTTTTNTTTTPNTSTKLTTTTTSTATSSSTTSTKEVWYKALLTAILNIKFSPLIALKCALLFVANMLAYFVAKGIQDWTALYLVEYLNYQEGPHLHIWELVLWSEVGGIIGAVSVGALSDLLHNRKSLASAMFAVVCIAGLWSLALHLPILQTDSGVYVMTDTSTIGGVGGVSSIGISSIGSSGSGISGSSSGISSIGGDVGSVVGGIVSSAVDVSTSSTFPPPTEHPTAHTLTMALDIHTKTLDTCLDPSPFTQNEFCIDTHNPGYVDTTNIHHPLEQCKSVLLHTVYVLFPQAGSTTLSASRYMTHLASDILNLLSVYVTIDRYFTMRCALFMIGFGFNGPKTLVMFELVELVPQQLCGTLTGVAGFFGQVGATYAGTFIAHTMIQEGWCSFVALLTMASVVMTGLLLVSAMI